jgi:resuscitation-promoting factor RpfA
VSDKDLDGIDQLAAAYRKLPRPEPSPTLDAAILAQARAALAKPARRTRWPAWVASAAAVTLAVGLAWQVRDRTETGQPAPFAPPPAPAESAPATPPEADFARQREEAPPLQDERRNEGFAAAPEAAAAKPAATEEKRELESAVAGERAREQQPEAGLAKQLGAGKDRSDAAPPRPMPVQEPAPAAAPPPPPAPAAPPADVLESIVIDEPAVAPAEPFPQSATGAPGRADTEAAVEQAPAKEDAPALRRKSAATGPETRDADRAELSADDATATTAPIGALGASSTRAGGKATDVELERIRELVRDGRRNEAKQALAEFRRRFPDAAVPEDLRGLLD